MKVAYFALLLMPPAATTLATDTTASLIVVEDVGGASALPYYHALNLQTDTPDQTITHALSPALPALTTRYNGADFLPVRSVRLRLGRVTPRVIEAPGLQPIFLIGDDTTSRRWLERRIDTLRALGAIGFVVQVDSVEALASLRRLAPGLALVPASGDDLALRLGLHHYPVLITPTGIEQ